MRTRTKIGLISMGSANLPAIIAFANNGGGTGAPPGPLCLPAGLLAAAMYFWPIIALAVQATAEIGRTTLAGQKKYRAWRKALTPEQLKALQLAEFAALMAVQHEVHKRVNSPEAKARRQHIVDQIMHGGA